MADGSRKDLLVALLEQGRSEEHRVWAQTSEADRQAQGTPETWALKDIAAHLSEWKERDASRLDAAGAGRTAEEALDFDATNAKIFEMHRGKTWEEVMGLEVKAYEHLLSSVEALSSEALFDPELHEWTHGQSLAGIAANAGYQHPLEHLSGFLLRRGDIDGAEAMLVRMVENMASVEDSPRARGAQHYNLACFYALNDMPTKALENLSRAFPLRPDLVDWSKQDTDLTSLRELPGLRALYRDQGD